MDVKRSKRALFSVYLLVMALAAASCGSSDGGGSTANTIDNNVRKGVDEQLSGATTSSGPAAKPQAKTMSDLEAQWAEERAAILKKIKDSKWGISADGKSATGPDGFKASTTSHPASSVWASSTPGPWIRP